MMFKINDKVKFVPYDEMNCRQGVVTNINHDDDSLQVFSDKKFYIVHCEDAILDDGLNARESVSEPLDNTMYTNIPERKKHYAEMKIEPLAVLNDWPIEQRIGVCRFMNIKYDMRLGHKDKAIQEAEKALDYAKALVQTLRGEDIDLSVKM